MANCVTCGDELHPERAEKYDYCTRPDCRDRNAEGLGSSRRRPVRKPGPRRALAPASSASSRPPWSETQENLALIYRSMGMKPDEIARKLGVSPFLVTQTLLVAPSQGKR